MPGPICSVASGIKAALPSEPYLPAGTGADRRCGVNNGSPLTFCLTWT